MRNSRRCPKCGYDAIARIQGCPRFGDDVGDFIPIGKGWADIASITRFVCLTCGFSEEYFETKFLNKIRSMFGRNYN